ncbi:cell wall hydrolase [Desulfolucanica intricata]|uniref:cell wall hydrolase n=1 Tax=Desulfolucanica intricata TaxID=1285191 RepID=UPI000836BA65|nr:cell wall hydrolase [Desulfolucanica intricata]
MNMILFEKYKFAVLFFFLLLIITLGILINNQLENNERILVLGDRGTDVTKVQKRLIDLNLYEGQTTGYYGFKSRKAVQEFQKKRNLPVTGDVDKKTWREILKKPDQPSLSEVKLLARVVEGEAADEPYTGKVAVAAVILNRLKNPSFPNTLAGVIYQPGAFESVSNGQVNRPLTQQSIKAARAAFNGMDPTGGALYFWNPAKPVNPWIWRKTIVTTIGQHVFAI